jgi:chromate transporter
MKKCSLLELCISFFKIGLFTFGGGYAMIPIMEQEVVEKKKWVNEEDIVSILAISESTPGPLAVNAATYIGYNIRGVLGSICATLSVVLPSFIIISIISLFFIEFKQNKIIEFMFNGIRCAVGVLVINAGIKMSKKTKVSVFNMILLFIALFLSVLTSIDIIFIILGSAIIGLIYYSFINTKELNKKESQE